MAEGPRTSGPADPVASAARDGGGSATDSPAEPVRHSPAGGDHAARVPDVPAGSPFFADLVRAHYAWERVLEGTNVAGAAQVDELERVYRKKLSEFRAVEGEIVEAYWCTRAPSAIALTARPRTRMEMVTANQRIRIHRVSNWMMPRGAEELEDLTNDCDELANRASEMLRSAPKRIALRSLYEIECHVLGFLERTEGQPTDPEISKFVRDERTRIAAARKSYNDAADKVARMGYVAGMLAGVFLLPMFAAFAALLIWIFGALQLQGKGSAGTQAFFACIAAGALGAVVSVLSRMGSPRRFGLDPDVGRRAIFFLGIYRPYVGSIFGVALYFLLQSSLLQVSPEKKFPTFVVVAFLGGFSERFVRVMLRDAEQSAGAPPPAGGRGPGAESDARRSR